MAVYDLWLSRNNKPTSANYVGHKGRLFYDENEKIIRISDGVTPGGFPLLPVPATTSTIGGIRPGIGLSVTTTGTLNLNVATTTTLGGVRLGPGVITNGQGQIIIDSEGLDFSFGDFAASNNIISVINADEDAVIRSNGTGSIRMVGKFYVHKTNGLITDYSTQPYVFGIEADGQTRVIVTQQDANAGAFNIIGSTTGAVKPPGQMGAMLQITGQLGQPARTYLDGNGSYASIVGRRWNGTITTSTQVLAGDDVLRINATAQTNAGMPSQAMAQIRIVATENQTATAQGSKMEFLVTRNGTSATVREVGLIIDNTGIEIPSPDSGVIFYGNTTGTVALRPSATAGNGIIVIPATSGTMVTTGDVESVSNTMLAGSIANNKLANSTISGAALGTNLAALTIGNGLTGGSYNGTSTVSIALNTATLMAQAVSAQQTSANALTGTTLASNVTGSSLTSVGTLTTLSVADGITDGIGNVRSVPLNNQTSAYIVAAADNGKMISITTGGVTLNTSTFASPYGQIVSIFNNSTSSQTITAGTGVTLHLAGTLSTGTRTLARYGVATITCVDVNRFVVSGAGLS